MDIIENNLTEKQSVKILYPATYPYPYGIKTGNTTAFEEKQCRHYF